MIRTMPWGLIGALALLVGIAFSPLLPDVARPPRLAGLSADPNLDQLLYEIYSGDVSQVCRALQRVGNVNERDVSGFTPLLHAAGACRNDGAAVARLLIDSGADTNVHDVAGKTPLIAAASMNRREVVATLLQAGSDPNARDNQGASALHASAEDSESLAVFQMLLDAGADPHVRDQDGKTPGDIALAAGNVSAVHLLESIEQSRSGAVVSRSRTGPP